MTGFQIFTRSLLVLLFDMGYDQIVDLNPINQDKLKTVGFLLKFSIYIIVPYTNFMYPRVF